MALEILKAHGFDRSGVKLARAPMRLRLPSRGNAGGIVFLQACQETGCEPRPLLKGQGQRFAQEGVKGGGAHEVNVTEGGFLATLA